MPAFLHDFALIANLLPYGLYGKPASPSLVVDSTGEKLYCIWEAEFTVFAAIEQRAVTRSIGINALTNDVVQIVALIIERDLAQLRFSAPLRRFRIAEKILYTVMRKEPNAKLLACPSRSMVKIATLVGFRPGLV